MSGNVESNCVDSVARWGNLATLEAWERRLFGVASRCMDMLRQWSHTTQPWMDTLRHWKHAVTGCKAHLAPGVLRLQLFGSWSRRFFARTRAGRRPSLTGKHLGARFGAGRRRAPALAHLPFFSTPQLLPKLPPPLCWRGCGSFLGR